MVGKVCKKRFASSQYRTDPKAGGTLRSENFYECIYDVLRNTYQNGKKIIMLYCLKAKVTKIHSDRLYVNVGQ
jgi:hypothetical protein